jgi:phosphopentomutase
MSTFKRVTIVILDSLGVGELPDAASYRDTGAHTLLHTFEALGGLKIPNLADLGLLQIMRNATFSQQVTGYFGRMQEKSRGKDTATGHWEMMGIVLETPFDVFLEGFPRELMTAWCKETGMGFLGNKPASGTVIIDELGAQHIQSGKPIVYTSADSVFQIACHEKYFGLQKLYDLCTATRKFLNESPHQIGRVIARPFEGEPGSFKRTENRKDYALSPFAETALDHLKASGISTVGIGKIPSIYDYKGISKKLEAHNDNQAIDATVSALKNEKQPGLIFTNLNDLDMIYGHRRNVEGYGHQIEHIDSRLPEILKELRDDDLLILAADHGNDPTYRGTDHTREYVPLIAYSPRFQKQTDQKRHLRDRESFADIGQTICENFGVPQIPNGKSFLAELL